MGLQRGALCFGVFMPFHDGLTAGPCSEERGDHAQPRHADEQPKGQRLLRPEQKCQRSGDHDQRRGEEDQEQRGSPIGLDGFGPLPQLRLCGGVKGVLFQSVPGLLRGLRGLLRGAALFRQGGQLTGKCGGLPLQQRQRRIVRQGGAVGRQRVGPGLGGQCRLRRLLTGVGLLLRSQRLPLSRLLPQIGGAALQSIQLPARLLRLVVQRVQLRQRGAQLVGLPFQGGYEPCLVVLAAVQLLFQAVVGLGVGGVLLTGGDQGGDAALQLGVLVHGQSVLADKGAALKHLPGHAQQHLAGVLAGNARNGRAGTGIGAGKLAQR